jgi:type I restriction enzyme S subunit
MTTPLHPYPAYRDSGVPWLGDVPAHWQERRLKHVATLNPSKSQERAALDNGAAVTFLNMDRVGADGTYRTDARMPISEVWSGFTYFRRGDVLVAKITPCFENGKGAVLDALPTEIGFGSTEFSVLRPSQSIDGRFLYRLTVTSEFRKRGQVYMAGAAGQQRVEDEFIATYPVALPPLAEQQAIVRYLDHVDRRIARFVRAKRRLIALLAEEKQALIHHAVTRGLDPAAPRKDSGIPWLGEIPAHWEVRRLKKVSPRISVGVVVNPSTYFAETGVPMLLGNNIRPGRILVDNVRRISHTSNLILSKTQVRAGDLVVVRVGAPGVSAVVPAELDGANCASVMLIRRSAEFVSKWLEHVFNSQVIRIQIDQVKYGAAQKQFNVSHAVDFMIPTPPILEQSEIVNAMNAQFLQIDQALANLGVQIDLIREYRTRLIADVVTGKVDVRGAAAGLPASGDDAIDALLAGGDADLAADADTSDDPGDDEVADTFPAAGEED